MALGLAGRPFIGGEAYARQGHATGLPRRPSQPGEPLRWPGDERSRRTVSASRLPARDCCALAVLGTHASYSAAGLRGPNHIRQYTSRLEVGVTIFFLLSGFLLYRPFARARILGQPRPRTAAFAWRRFLRIAPAYWAALTFAAVVVGLPGDVLSLSGVVHYYGFLQIYDPRTALSGIAQAWTLCVEITFYIFLPIWALGLRAVKGDTPQARMRSEAWALAGLFLVGVAWNIAILRVPSMQTLAPSWLPAFFDQFAVGMGLAIFTIHLETSPIPRALRWVESAPWLAWLGALFAFWFMSTQIGLHGGFEHIAPTRSSSATTSSCSSASASCCPR